MSNEPIVKRWTAKRNAAVVMDIFKGKATVAEVARQHDLTVSEIEGWMDEAQRSIEVTPSRAAQAIVQPSGG